MMKRLIIGALTALALLGAATAQIFTGNAIPAGSYDYTVTFGSLTIGSRFNLTAQQSVFSDSSIVWQANSDTGTIPIFTIVDVSGFPGGHSHGLQALMPYGSLGENLYAGCPTACPISGYGSLNNFQVGLGDASTINTEYDVLFIPGFDYRYVSGKIGPTLQYYTGTNSPSQSGGLKSIWRASSNQTLCPENNVWPANGACIATLEFYYFASFGTPVSSVSTSWTVSNGTWHHFKQQFHRGCPIDQGGCVDHSYTNFYGPTSDSNNTQILLYTHNPLSAEVNSNTSTGYSPQFAINQWFGGGNPNNACAQGSLTAGSGCAIVYDNIRIWSGTGP